MLASLASQRVLLCTRISTRKTYPRTVCQAVCRPDGQNHVLRRSILLASGAMMLGSMELPALARKLPAPKAYPLFVDKLATELIETIELEASGASEPEVRRKADSAKVLVREFVLSWRGDIRVAKEPSYNELAEALTVLGNFYINNGQRTKLPEDLASEILGHLKAAQSSVQAAT